MGILVFMVNRRIYTVLGAVFGAALVSKLWKADELNGAIGSLVGTGPDGAPFLTALVVLTLAVLTALLCYGAVSKRPSRWIA